MGYLGVGIPHLPILKAVSGTRSSKHPRNINIDDIQSGPKVS
jgi:hypothetical protein